MGKDRCNSVRLGLVVTLLSQPNRTQLNSDNLLGWFPTPANTTHHPHHQKLLDHFPSSWWRWFLNPTLEDLCRRSWLNPKWPNPKWPNPKWLIPIWSNPSWPNSKWPNIINWYFQASFVFNNFSRILSGQRLAPCSQTWELCLRVPQAIFGPLWFLTVKRSKLGG